MIMLQKFYGESFCMKTFKQNHDFEQLMSSTNLRIMTDVDLITNKIIQRTYLQSGRGKWVQIGVMHRQQPRNERVKVFVNLTHDESTSKFVDSKPQQQRSICTIL